MGFLEALKSIATTGLPEDNYGPSSTIKSLKNLNQGVEEPVNSTVFSPFNEGFNQVVEKAQAVVGAELANNIYQTFLNGAVETPPEKSTSRLNSSENFTKAKQLSKKAASLVFNGLASGIEAIKKTQRNKLNKSTRPSLNSSNIEVVDGDFHEVSD